MYVLIKDSGEHI